MTAATLELVLLGVLLVSALVGAWRGLTFEVLALAGWIAAFLAAQALAAVVAPMLPIGTSSSALNHVAAFAIVFLLVLVVCSLGARLVRALVHATPLSGLDRVFGALFGVLRGLVLLLALATLVLLTPMKNSTSWQQSQLAQVMSSALRHLKPLLPAELAQHLPA